MNLSSLFKYFVKATLLSSMLFAATALGQNVDMKVSVNIDRDSIGLDEYATLMIVVSGSSQNLPAPKLPTLPKFEVYSQGRSSNISISNGKISSTVTYRYLLLPKESGVFPIKGIWVVYNNSRFIGNDVELTVLNQGTSAPKSLEDQAVNSAGSSRDYFLEALIDNRNPYVNEQVTLTLKFYIAVKYYGSPSLNEPTLTGFWNEVLGNKAPYLQKIGGKTYKIIERKYALFPTRTGALTIGRAAITTTVVTKSGRRDPFSSFFDSGFGRGKQITVRSEPIEIKVKKLPDRGRPSNFTGTIGKFTISSSIDKKEVEVNQPVSLTIKISGVGNIKSIAEPIIPESDKFRIYRESSNEAISKINDQLGGTKTFEEVFIPKRPGNLQIPALEFNFFNPKSEKYQTIRTRPWKLKVIRPEGYLAAPYLPFGRGDLAVGTNSQDIRYIKPEIGNLVFPNQIILTNPFYLAVNGLPVLVMAGMIAMRRRRERMVGDIGYARSRSASSAARKRLSKARSLARIESAEEFYAAISSAIMSYVADKLNVSAHGLTSDQLAELLSERGASGDLIADMKELLKQCDFVRFAPGSVTQENIDGANKQAEDVMTRMEGVRLV